MKWLSSLVVWVLAGVALAWALDNTAMVSLFVGSQRIDLSLNVVMIALVAVCWLLLSLKNLSAGLRLAAAKAKFGFDDTNEWQHMCDYTGDFVTPVKLD